MKAPTPLLRLSSGTGNTYQIPSPQPDTLILMPIRQAQDKPFDSTQGKQNITKRQVVWTGAVALILLIPLAMQFQPFTDEVQWNEAIAYGVILLIAGGFYELWLWLQTRTGAYRIAFGVGLAGMLFLGWVSGAVGIIGSENQPVNLMYWAVPAVLLIGSLISRFKPRGMARTLFATALVQVLVPVVALIISPEVSWGNVGVIGVFVVNSIFALMFVGSALLFRRASASTTKLEA